MPEPDSRRHRQQQSNDGDLVEFMLELESESELFDELLVLCCIGWAKGRWAAAVCSWRSLEASGEVDMWSSSDKDRTARSGWDGSESVSVE
jgi:hypothetical protein